MPYTIRTKDGIEIPDIPDDVAPDADELKQRVAQARARRDIRPEIEAREKAFAEGVRGSIASQAPDVPIPMMGGITLRDAENAAMGITKGVGDMWLAAKQAAAAGGLGDKEALAKEAAEKKRVGAPLMRTTAGMAGSMVPDLALAFTPLGGAKFLPQIGRAMGAGAVSGALAPEEDYSLGKQLATGAAFGAGGDIAGRAVGFAAAPFRKGSKTAQENAAILEGAGLPEPRAVTRTDSPLVRNLSNALEQIPVVGQPLIKAREKNLEWLTRQASEDTGKVVSEITPSAREALKKKANDIGNTFRTQTKVDLYGAPTEIQAAMDSVFEHAMTTNQARKLKPLIAAREGVSPAPGVTHPKQMTTDQLMDLRANASELAYGEKDPKLRAAYNAVKEYYETAIRSVQPDGGAAFDKWLKEWGATKDLLTAERKGTEGGRLSAQALAETMLPRNVMQQFSPKEKVFAAAAENIPEKMGGWNRALYTSLLLGAPITSGVLGTLGTGDLGPGTALGAGVAGAAWNALARKPVSPETIELLRKFITSGTIASGN